MPENLPSLDAARSPEQLDEGVRLASSLGWLAVLAFAVITGSIVVWGFVGKLPSRVVGIGFLMAAEDRLFPVLAAEPATVQRIHSAVGDQVHEGQLLVSLVQPLVGLELEQAVQTAVELESELARRTEMQREDLARHNSLTEVRQAVLRRKLGARKEHHNYLRELLNNQLDQLKRGYIRRAEIEQTRVDLHAVEAELLSLETDIIDEEKRRRDYEEQQDDLVERLRQRVMEARNKVDAIRLRMNVADELRSPVDGVVIEIAADAGKEVASGQRLATVEEPSDDLSVELFVRLVDSKRIASGMPVQVALSSVEVEEYGTIIGKVRSVAPQPVSRAQLLNRFENQDVVDLITQAGPPVSIEVELLRDPATPSGFRWSSSGGPPARVAGGTLVSASITYQERPPVDFVIPLVRTFARARDDG